MYAFPQIFCTLFQNLRVNVNCTMGSKHIKIVYCLVRNLCVTFVISSLDLFSVQVWYTCIVEWNSLFDALYDICDFGRNRTLNLHLQTLRCSRWIEYDHRDILSSWCLRQLFHKEQQILLSAVDSKICINLVKNLEAKCEQTAVLYPEDTKMFIAKCFILKIAKCLLLSVDYSNIAVSSR